MLADQIAHVVFAKAGSRSDGLPQIMVSADGEVILEKLRKSCAEIGNGIVGSKQHIGFDENEIRMLVIQPVFEQIVRFRGLRRAFAQVKGSVSLVLPEVHGGDAYHGKAVSYIIDIDTVPGDRCDLRVPGISVLDSPFQKPAARVQKDPGSDKEERQEQKEGGDLKKRSYGNGIFW